MTFEGFKNQTSFGCGLPCTESLIVVGTVPLQRPLEIRDLIPTPARAVTNATVRKGGTIVAPTPMSTKSVP